MATMNSEADCVVSPTSATPLQPSQHNRFLNNGSQQTQTQTPFSQRMLTDKCFRCDELGHWAFQCPRKTPTKSTPTKSTASPSTPTPSFPIPPCDLPAVLCPHCQVICTVKVSRSVENPDKKYYTCPIGRENGHKFFKWFDDVIEDSNQIPPSSMIPRCGCDAGKCRLMVDLNGRYYFVCPIAKGHGACRFRRYMDDTLATDTSNHGLREGGEPSFEQSKKRKFESLIMDNPQHPSSFVSAITEPVENVEEALIEREENDFSSGMSTLQDVVPEEVVSLDHLMEKAPQVSSLRSQAIQRRQAEFWRQISAAGDASIADPINQFIGLQILGWLGRLAFPPSGCLTVVPPRPFFCCVFPSFDPIFVPKDVYVFDLEGLSDQPNNPSNAESESSQQIVSQDSQRSSGVLFELSGLENVCGVQQGFDVNGPIVEVLRQAALLCQRELLSRLDTMDPLDHKKMALVADHYFTALNHLSADFTSFSERVRKFIARASSLAEIERSINADSSAQEIMERYEEEKLRYTNISRSYAQTVDAVTASEQHIKSLRKEASRVKEMLLKIENQLTCYEAENEKLKSQACEITENMVESEKKMHDACEEVEAAKRLGEEREAARSAAKAALEEARIQLRR